MIYLDPAMIKEFIKKEDAAHIQYWLIKDINKCKEPGKRRTIRLNKVFVKPYIFSFFFLLYVGNRWKLCVKDILNSHRDQPLPYPASLQPNCGYNNLVRTWVDITIKIYLTDILKTHREMCNIDCFSDSVLRLAHISICVVVFIIVFIIVFC